MHLREQSVQRVACRKPRKDSIPPNATQLARLRKRGVASKWIRFYASSARQVKQARARTPLCSLILSPPKAWLSWILLPVKRDRTMAARWGEASLKGPAVHEGIHSVAADELNQSAFPF